MLIMLLCFYSFSITLMITRLILQGNDKGFAHEPDGFGEYCELLMQFINHDSLVGFLTLSKMVVRNSRIINFLTTTVEMN